MASILRIGDLRLPPRGVHSRPQVHAQYDSVLRLTLEGRSAHGRSIREKAAQGGEAELRRGGAAPSRGSTHPVGVV